MVRLLLKGLYLLRYKAELVFTVLKVGQYNMDELILGQG